MNELFVFPWPFPVTIYPNAGRNVTLESTEYGYTYRICIARKDLPKIIVELQELQKAFENEDAAGA
jgi:hypothetical protein